MYPAHPCPVPVMRFPSKKKSTVHPPGQRPTRTLRAVPMVRFAASGVLSIRGAIALSGKQVEVGAARDRPPFQWTYVQRDHLWQRGD